MSIVAISASGSDTVDNGNPAPTLPGQSLATDIAAPHELKSFVGASLEEVQAVADDMGWVVTVKQKESGKPAGTVLSQDPKAGTLMDAGATLTVVVAKALPPKAPNLVGKKQKAAETAAETYGWKLVIKKEVSSKPAGTILRQTPAPGKVMRGAATLTIWIAKKAPVAPSTPTSGGGGGGGNCHSSYTGACLDPNASDYDCAGGSGNGPKYVAGPVYVVGPDVFGLDADGDGVGCE